MKKAAVPAAAFVVQPFQLTHGAAQLAGDAPEATPFLHGVGGVPQD